MFITIFIIFTIIEFYSVIQFARKKIPALIKETILSYILFCVYLVIEYFLKIQVSDYILILVMISMLGHTFIGNCLNFYNSSKHYDRYLHIFGSFSFAIFSYSVIVSITHPNINSKIYSALFVVTLGISIGAIFEIIEFISDSLTKKNNQRGLKDTNFDLIADIIGSFIAGIFAYNIIFT